MAEAPSPADFFSTIHVTAGTEGAPPQGSPSSATPAVDPLMATLLQTVVDQNRELIQLSRRQLEISQRMEERYEKQVIAQRDEFLRWVNETPGLSQRGKDASEAVRNLLGKMIDDLVVYIDDNSDNIHDSEFVRNEMVDRYGQSLNHLSAMYGMLKRLATADEGAPPIG